MFSCLSPCDAYFVLTGSIFTARISNDLLTANFCLLLSASSVSPGKRSMIYFERNKKKLSGIELTDWKHPILAESQENYVESCPDSKRGLAEVCQINHVYVWVIKFTYKSFKKGNREIYRGWNELVETRIEKRIHTCARTQKWKENKTHTYTWAHAYI